MKRRIMYLYIATIALVLLFTTVQSFEYLVDMAYAAYSSPGRNMDPPIPIADFMTRTSGFCGNSTVNCTAHVSTSRIARVDLIGWAASDFNIGTYACPLTTCVLSKHTWGTVGYDILVSSLPPRIRFPSRPSSQTRHVEISIESSTNTYSFISIRYYMEAVVSWLLATPFAPNVDLVVRYQPLDDENPVQFLQTSYINAEMEAFLSTGNATGNALGSATGHRDSRWLDYGSRDPGMAVVISNCWQRNNNRIDMLNDILKVFSRVHKFGGCFKWDESARVVPTVLQECLSLHRRGAMWDHPKKCILKNVMFSYSIENSFEYGYLTEKLWQALQMGAIPVYSIRGVPENRKFLPHPDAALVVEDFASTEQLAMYMLQVSKNRTLWFKHAMAWRYLPTTEVSRDFISVVNNSLTTLPCRICDWWAATVDDEEDLKRTGIRW
jgi:hypothetical protein